MSYEECARKGMTQSETARFMGVTREAVRQYAMRRNLDFAKGRQRGIPIDGYESQSALARAEGVTPQAIWNRVSRKNG